MVTEQEYIDLTDLTKVRNAKKILSDITPENSTVITKEDWQKIMTALWKWEKALLMGIKIKRQD